MDDIGRGLVVLLGALVAGVAGFVIFGRSRTSREDADPDPPTDPDPPPSDPDPPT